MFKTIKTLMLVAPVALLLGVLAPTGCDAGGGCVSNCEDSKDCEGSAVPEDFDCQASCDEQRQVAVDAGCESEYDDTDKACGGGDVCDPADVTEDCAEKVAAYVTCAAAAVTP